MPEGMQNPHLSTIDVPSFANDLTVLLNRHGLDQFTGMPDFLLAEALLAHLSIIAGMTYQREVWFGRA